MLPLFHRSSSLNLWRQGKSLDVSELWLYRTQEGPYLYWGLYPLANHDPSLSVVVANQIAYVEPSTVSPVGVEVRLEQLKQFQPRSTGQFLAALRELKVVPKAYSFVRSSVFAQLDAMYKGVNVLPSPFDEGGQYFNVKGDEGQLLSTNLVQRQDPATSRGQVLRYYSLQTTTEYTGNTFSFSEFEGLPTYTPRQFANNEPDSPTYLPKAAMLSYNEAMYIAHAPRLDLSPIATSPA